VGGMGDKRLKIVFDNAKWKGQRDRCRRRWNYCIKIDAA
jgi:hypothetical protein